MQAGVAVWHGQGKHIHILLLVEVEAKAEHIVSLVHGGAIEEDLTLGQTLPFWPAGRLDERRQTGVEQIAALADVHNVEEHALILFHIVDCEIEPEAKARIAGVWPQKQIILELAHQLRFAQIAGLKGRIEAQVATFGLAALPGRTDYHSGDIAQSALTIAVLAIWNCK